MVTAPLKYRHMAQSSLWRAETEVFIENCTHILIGWQHTLHKYISLTGRYSCCCKQRSLNITLLVDNTENRAVDIHIAANLLNNDTVSIENWLNKSLIISVIDRLNSVRILTISYCKAASATHLCSLNYLL